MPDPSTDPALAHHHVANLLHGYTDVADRHDVDAGVALLGHATVRFPTDGFDRPEDARAFLERLWGGGAAHRHDVTNLVVEPAGPGLWRARAHYTRHVLDPDPVLTTLGDYDLLVQEPDGDDQPWTVRELTVRRSWAR